jgi:hypothetical protein
LLFCVRFPDSSCSATAPPENTAAAASPPVRWIPGEKRANVSSSAAGAGRRSRSDIVGI